MQLLLVCFGNTCRSAMAQALAEQMLAEEPAGTMTIRSAGIFAAGGAPASLMAQKVMAKRGISLAGHRATPVQLDLVAESDLVLTMEGRHRQLLCERMPEHAHKIHELLAFAGSSGDVSDPYGGDEEVYQACADELTAALQALLARLRRTEGPL
ncbi:low molecular weight protein arginine phosphatase [Heliophilum fasciatum]|uniref:Protein-tyrosine phosphatase n=1 Tax=Heliophilum fasciatum TaxID=35700 RepID=A0A4R2RYY1_9FIRM|nr:low molecular weight protein arginine phosphatase [Heliophilum fasciatum]MCW2277488.1 protein-tyrosine phosphatase [Heliophilum fasciatum]TCP65221.1 protein-tyrosine phosphatase [Heliophilum fasciatum]